MTSKNNSKMIKQKIDEDLNPISIITREFTDLDIQIWFKNEYDVIILDKAMAWNNFLKWFHPLARVKPLFSTLSKKMIVVNTDLLTRIPKEKTEPQKKKKTSVYNFIMYIRFSVDFPVIFITEKPKKDYRLQVSPIIIGEIIDYSDPIYIINQILYNLNIDDVEIALRKYGNFYDPLIYILNDHLQRYDPNYFLKVNLIKNYYKLRFESDIRTIRKLLASAFKIVRKARVNYPTGYFLTFKYMKKSIKLLRSI